MPKVQQDDDAFEVPLTPLIDVVFLLLIFFLVATNFTRKEIDHQVRLPKSEGGVKQEIVPENLVINVRKDGTVVIDGRVVEKDDLRMRVVAWHEQNPQKRVDLRGDADVPYRHMARVMGMCKAVGVEQVDLPVEEVGARGPGP